MLEYQSNKASLGDVVVSNVLFSHSLLGCDTTSRLYGIGKAKALSKIKMNSFFVHQAQVFMKSNSEKAAVIEAGDHALVAIYNGLQGENLDGLRLRKFCEKATCNTALVEPRTLPPLHPLQSSTASRCISRLKFGSKKISRSHQKIGAGKIWMENWSRY